MDVLERARQRRKAAQHILSQLLLLERWTRFGRPVVVGAVAYDLVVAPDIDMEVYCPELRIEHGFDVLAACAVHPNVTKARFANELSGRDQGLYWQMRYRHDDGEEWKIDMWSVDEDYSLPRSANLVAPMRTALIPETRRAVLELKEYRQAVGLTCPSIDLYRAVLDDGVRTPEQLQSWLEGHPTGELTNWQPGPP